MFVSDKIVYIQLQKTGCTHIAALLQAHVGGELIGKHNPASPALIDSGRTCISSIRNPWDWYASLWTYGTDNHGGLKYRLTTEDLYRERGRDPAAAAEWSKVYRSSKDKVAFRAWLEMILDPDNATLLGEKYSETRAPAVCGFMTYRYLKLCCHPKDLLALPGHIDDYASLEEFNRKHCYIRHFIRQESLPEDFIAIVNQFHPLEKRSLGEIRRNKKTNSSSRALSLNELYDEASFQRVAKRDLLICKTFNYKKLV